MTERERWIVYPLLFLALGTSMRGKLGLAEDEITAKKIVIVDSESGKPTILIKDGVIIAKKVEETEPAKGKQVVAKDLICDNLIVKNQIRAKQQVSNEFVLADHDNEQRILAKLFKDPKSGSGTFYLVNEAGLPIVGMRSTNNNVGRIELWQQTTGNLAQIRQAINADGKPGVWETYPIITPKPNLQKNKSDANNASKKTGNAKSKTDSDKTKSPENEDDSEKTDQPKNENEE